MDFLSQRSDQAIRKEIASIRDSYHHYWDLLAELLQNSRDAITRKRKSGHNGPFFIKIEIDPASNSIDVLDNGSGITKDLLTEILAPGGGDKGSSSDRGEEVGEKGVGLTYAVFSSNHFSILTKAEGSELCGGIIRDAQRWLSGEGNATRPEFEPSSSHQEVEASIQIGGKSYPLDTFTHIRASSVLPPEEDINLFQMNAAELRLLLRTRTAIGVTKNLFSDDVDQEFDTYLSLNNSSAIAPIEVPSNFVAPHTMVPARNLLPFEDVRSTFVAHGDNSTRRRYLNGKTVWARTTERVSNWEVDVYGVMFPDNDALSQLAQSVMGVPPRDQDRDSQLLENAIFVGTKGMPTGMKIPPPTGGRYPAYYKRCFFFVESPNLKFDLGRKSLHYQYVRKLQSAVAKLFGEFEGIVRYQGEARVEPGESVITPAERRAASQEVWRQAEELADLGESKIRYQKHPNEQEAAVAAIFHELVGAGVLSAYRSLRTGYSERYDLHARHVSTNRSINIVIEFKYSLESLVRDLEDRKKYFADIDLLVAWDANVGRLRQSGFLLEAVGSAAYEGVTHELTVPLEGIAPIPVILLRTYLDRRRSSDQQP